MANDLIKTGEHGGSGPPTLPPGVFGDASLIEQYSASVLTSLKLDDDEDQALYMLSQEKGHMDGRRGVNQIVCAKHFLLRDATRRNMQTKELERCHLLTLIGPEGECWSTTSEPAIRSFFMLCSLRGLPPWTPARTLRIKPVPTSLGTDTYILTEHLEGHKPSKSKQRPNG